jgi:endonuclease YncB( thermonuclease family)
MPAARENDWGRSMLLCGCALVALGWAGVGGARAQPADPGKPAAPSAAAASANQAGGLDMDVNPTAPAVAPNQTEAGGLDMDVNPTAPAATPAPVVASKPGNIQALSPDNVVDGVHIAITNPGPLEAPPAGGQPGSQPTATPASLTSPVAGTPGPATEAPAPAAGAPPAEAPATGALPAVQPEPVNIDHPTVVDTADLKAGDRIVALYGIDGLQGEAAQGLQGFLGSTESHLTCQAQTGSGFVCLLPDGTDVAEVALVNGAARAKDDAPDAYRDQEAAAQAARRGIWANLPPPPATLKHPTVQDTATLVADGQTYVLNGILGLGAPYAAQLQGYIAANGDSLTCQPQIEPGQYICMLTDGTDIAKVALVNGAARVAPDAPDAYRAQQLDALNNKRGLWLNPTQEILLAASSVQAVEVCCALQPGDDGADGIVYVAGVPEAVIDGDPEFLYYGGDDLGWGYYDHFHHWRNAPDRFRHHLEHFHPDGHGLRGYGHDAEVRRDVAMRREEAVRHDEGLRHDAVAHGEVGHVGGMGGAVHPAMAGAVHPGMAGAAHPGMAGAAHPGMVGAAHPGMVGAAGHPGGFMRPAPSAGGFHPGGMAAAHAAAPAVHASAGGGGARRK